MIRLFNKGLIWAFYYGVLLFLLIAWNNETPPPMLYRIGFLFAFTVPLVCYSRFLLPPSLIMFCLVSKFSPYPTFMPTEPIVYVSMMVILTIILWPRPKVRLHFPIEMILFMIYTILIDVITTGSIHTISYCIASIIMVSLFVDLKKQNLINLLSTSFAVASFLLSLVFFRSMAEFTLLVDASQNVERVEWTDPNYFGFVMGMGVFTSIVNLFSIKETHWAMKTFYISTIVMSSVVLVLNASRGAILGVLIVSAIMLAFSKIKIRYKILAALFSVALAVFLYREGYMDLLMYRVTEGAGDGGGGRVQIWQRKLHSFFNESNVLEFIFGMGYQNGYNLGFSHGQGFHNDFIAILVDYGFLGFVLFLFSLFKLFILALKNGISCFCAWLYFILCGMTLEPLTLGVFPYFLYYLFSLIFITFCSQNKQPALIVQ